MQQLKPGTSSFTMALRLALREMRGGLTGFYIFLGCIALGVAAIGGVNSVAKSITEAISSQGQVILGGDIAFSIVQREATPEQKTFFRQFGGVTEIVNMRALARLVDGSDQTLVELKAVDSAYPVYGELLTDPPQSETLAPNAVFAESLLLERLALNVGDTIEVGSATFTVAGTILREPDKAGDNIGFGPRLMMSLEALERTGLVQPGSLLRYHYKIKMADPSDNNVEATVEQARAEYPDVGWRIRTRDNAAPALSRSVERFSQFLTLVGLTSLIVGGVGVANATRAFFETKRESIATLKSVGASGTLIFRTYLLQILIISTVGIFMGLLLAVVMPYAARGALGTLLPVSEGSLFFPVALFPAILFGYLTALIFAIWPLAVAREIQPSDLFRASSYGGQGTRPRLVYIILVAALAMALAGFAIFGTENRFVAAVFVGAMLVSFVLLALIARAVQWIASKAPSGPSVPLKMAVANIHRTGSLTPSVVLSLGLGLTLLVALSQIDGNLRQQIADNLPENAPDFFFVDIQNNEIEPFRDTLQELSPAGKIVSVPMLRGRVVSLKGIPAADFEPVSGGEWVLRGDRGITYAKRVPENSTLSDGEWWPEDYQGEQLVSVSAEEAGELGLEVGDAITVNVLGRNISATIASLRDVQWETLGINFVFVFSPNTFAGAPHAHLATLDTNAENSKNGDATLLRKLAVDFPAVTAVRIRDALDTVNRLVGQLSVAIRAAASVALLSSVLVLAGALAAGNRQRTHDSVILKTLGATRKTLMRMFIYEYALLGAATAIFAVLAGSLAGWFVISVIMGFNFAFLPAVAIGTILSALAFTVILGLLGTWRILGQKAGPALREL